MAISKDDTVLTYSKFKDFWTQFAVLFNKKLDGTGVANNDTTTSEGYVLDARVGKTHGDEIDTLKDQMNGCYIAYDSNGKLGIKASKNGAVQSFRQPTGDAVAANVLVGKTFANKTSDSNTGTMPNNGDVSKTVTPTGNNSASVTIPAGYTTGGTITADGTTSYKAGYSAGYTDGDSYDNANITIVVHTGANSNGYAVMPIPKGYKTIKITSVTNKGWGSIAFDLSTTYNIMAVGTSYSLDGHYSVGMYSDANDPLLECDVTYVLSKS